MVYKTLFTISGKHFQPDNCLPFIQGDHILASKHSPSDKKSTNRDVTYNYGAMSLWHPNRFAHTKYLVEYEKSLIGLLVTNYNLFIKCGADEFDFYIEVFYSGDECNFEIFNKEQLKQISGMMVSLPISVYHWEDIKLRDWMDEIEDTWSSA